MTTNSFVGNHCRASTPPRHPKSLLTSPGPGQWQVQCSGERPGRVGMANVEKSRTILRESVTAGCRGRRGQGGKSRKVHGRAKGSLDLALKMG